MASSIKYAKHKDFPQENAEFLASGWFWKMNMREWAYAKLNVVSTVPFKMTVTAGTNNMGVIRNLKLIRSGDPKQVTISFYAHSSGNAYVHLCDAAAKNPLSAVEDTLMQVVVGTRRAASEKGISLTKLEGKTAAINAPDTQAYKLSSTQSFTSDDPRELFKSVPSGADHVVIASHGMEVGGNICMFVGGGNKPSQRLGLDNCEVVFGTLKGKVSANCVVWLGGCTIGQNIEFCKLAAKASGCPVIAAGHVLVNKGFAQDFIDILDRVSMPKLFLPGESAPSSLGDFCAKQETHKFVVPV